MTFANRPKKKKKKSKVALTVPRTNVSKVRSGQRLSPEDVEKMFMVYVANPVLRGVSKALHVSIPTVRKYRDRDNWDRRRQEILDRVRRKDGNETAKALSANLKVVRFAKAKLVKSIQAGKDKHTSTFGELDRMIRLEAYLLGQPDSRTAVGRFEHLTDEQLDERLHKFKTFTDIEKDEPSSQN